MIKRLAFLASYNGSSARAICAACDSGTIAADPVLMISNNPGSAALTWASEQRLKTYCLNEKNLGGAEALDQEIAHILRDHKIDLVICSGYMKLIGEKTITAMDGNILNVHPALLPKHGGKGMYGRAIHDSVKQAGDEETGITIHYVDGEYDHGKILAQKKIPVAVDDTAEDIENNVKAHEPEFYIQTLKNLLNKDEN